MEVIVRYELTCRLTGEKFNRMEVGYCTTPDGTDIAQAIVATGWALACPIHDDRYVKFEKSEAEKGGSGGQQHLHSACVSTATAIVLLREAPLDRVSPPPLAMVLSPRRHC